MSSEFIKDGDWWLVLIQLLLFVEVVHVVTYSEELLVVVRASKKDACHSYNVVLQDLGNIWWVALIRK